MVLIRRIKALWGREARSGGYSDALVSQYYAHAAGDTEPTDYWRIHAVESAIGLYSRAFMMAEVSPSMRELSPSMLSWIVRSMLTYGEAVARITADGILPAWSYDVRGGADPRTWRYRLTHGAPDGSVSRSVSSADVLHWRYAVEASRPHVGVGPLQIAHVSARALSRLEKSIGEEARLLTASIIPTPGISLQGQDSEGKAEVDDFIRDLKAGGGKVNFAPTFADAYGQGMSGAPQRDWGVVRLGPQYTQSQVEMYRILTREVLAALGVPVELAEPGGESGSREAYRRFLHSSILPLARLIEDEVRDKLEVDVRLDFDALMAADMRARAQALKGLVEAGISLADAREMLALEQ